MVVCTGYLGPIRERASTVSKKNWGPYRDGILSTRRKYIRFEGEDGKVFSVYTDIDRLERHMKKLAPEDARVIEELAKQVRKYTRFEIPVEKARELYSLIDGLKELQINGVKNLDLDKIVVRRRKLDVCFYRL